MPTLRTGEIVVMDDPTAQKRAEVRRAIETAGCLLLLPPPYSPDLNSIELAFSKLKSLLRNAGSRTLDGLWEFLGQTLDAHSREECLDDMRRCGRTATGR